MEEYKTMNDMRAQGRRNNAQGHSFENYIMGACKRYDDLGVAKITKVPEPFRTLRKYRDGTATVRFTGNAEPDFMGCQKGGELIAFEAKRTLTNKLMQNAVTEHQWDALERYAQLGGTTGVCAGIGDETFWIDWDIWKNMKQIYGHKYITAADVQPFRVVFDGSILFLDPMDDAAYVKEMLRIDVLLGK